jgi:hypothetical protein
LVKPALSVDKTSKLTHGEKRIMVFPAALDARYNIPSQGLLDAPVRLKAGPAQDRQLSRPTQGRTERSLFDRFVRPSFYRQVAVFHLAFPRCSNGKERTIQLRRRFKRVEPLAQRLAR